MNLGLDEAPVVLQRGGERAAEAIRTIGCPMPNSAGSRLMRRS